MKKIITIIFFSASVLFANETDNELAQLTEEIDRYVELKLQTYQADPDFYSTRFAMQHTFAWYLWNNFDSAEGFRKLQIAERILKLSKQKQTKGKK